MKRYSYRAYPTTAQQQCLSRVFGCVRVVFNDFLNAREAAHQAGKQPESASRLQSRLITEAKHTTQRSWLAGVSATPLQQAVRDADRAYRNWFDSMTGRRKGPKVGKPRFKSRKDHRQSARFTRQSKFKVHQTSHSVGKVFLPKIGWVRFSLSRPLPSPPSSVTVIKDPDGTYHLSFVVDTPPIPPAPAVDRVAAIDAGIGDDLAVIIYSDGTREKISNPRHLRSAQRHLARTQRAFSRTQKGSANRDKARLRVARAHSVVKHARLDHHHKLAARLTTSNQTLAIEDLSLTGMGRTRLAKSVHDAGIGLLYRLIHEKAETQGRTVVTIGRWEPTTQTCSVCGTPGGKKPLHIRAWTCQGCGTVLDRDFNAAVNIMVAAGLADTLNACGPDVRRTLACAIGDEAGTHRTTAVT